jgi:hypothetical protein
MPKFLEDKLKKRYGKKSKIPYKIMNTIGAMHGNKETEKGREMEKTHIAGLGGQSKKHPMKKGKKKSFAEAMKG